MKIKVETHPTGTNFYGGLVNSLRAQVLPVPGSTDWYVSRWTGHTNTGWVMEQFGTRMEATVAARRALGLIAGKAA